jgi:transmembrane sensor
MRAMHVDSQSNDHDTALGWVARFRSDSVTDEDRQSFALWLAEDPSHKQAMDSMLDMWDDLASVRLLYPDNATHTPTTAANHSNWWRASVATAAGLVLALVMWPQVSPDTEAGTHYQTALGEQQTIELVDGSTITLNTNSHAVVSYNSEHRSIELLEGEAFFEVAKDPSRPFDVDAGSARVTAIGTAFNIYRHQQVSSITVTEGVVRVTELGNTGNRAPATETMHENQQLTASAKGLKAVTASDVRVNTAWLSGQLVAQDMTLTDLVREIARYHDAHILIADNNIAALTISGVFKLEELEPILQALQISLDLELVTLNDYTFQLIKNPSNI